MNLSDQTRKEIRLLIVEEMQKINAAFMEQAGQYFDSEAKILYKNHAKIMSEILSKRHGKVPNNEE